LTELLHVYTVHGHYLEVVGVDVHGYGNRKVAIHIYTLTPSCWLNSSRRLLLLRRHLTIVNRKMHCAFLCDRSNHRGLLIFIVPFALYMRLIFLCSLLLACLIYTYVLYCTCVHYIEVFFAEGIKKSVHCSELGGVH